MYDKLFTPAKIGSCTIKNRVVMTAMTTGFAGLDGAPTEQMCQYFEDRAKGGVGLIITEIFRINNETGVSHPRQLYALNPMNVAPIAVMVDRVHQYGTKIFAQVHHGGSTNIPQMNPGGIVAPSAVPNVMGITPEPLTLEQIAELQQQYIGTAVAAKAAGFDGVEVHGAHGYLICQFFSKAFNKREDQYGGSLENRTRFAVEIIQGIKMACGPDFPVAVRFSCDEHDPFHPDCIKLDEGIEIAKILEAAGADMLDVSNGNYFTAYGENEEPYSYAEGWRRPETQAIKDVVSVPVCGVSNIKTPDVAETLLEDGVCDFVGVGRGHFADPEWCNKAAAGRNDLIHHCIGCIYCFESMGTIGCVRCSVNPKLGREAAFAAEPEKNGDGANVAVVGGGVAGMQAAAVLGKRGFNVTLYEKESKLGGELNLAEATAPYKAKVGWLRTTLEAEMEEAGVNVVLGCDATPELVKQGNPTAVFLATGGLPSIPSVPGMDEESVALAADVISGKRQVSGKVVIVGAGLTGLETAEMLLRDGKAESVTVVDRSPQIGAGIYYSVFVDVTKQMAGQPLEMKASCELEQVASDGILVKNLATGEEEVIAADYVVIAAGVRNDMDTIAAFEAEFNRVIPLGQTHKNPGRIATSMTEAYIAARGFNPLA